MDVWQAIRTRRSIGKVKPDPVERHLIEQLLDAAVRAPDHFGSEPWRFFVITGEGRRVLGNVLAEIVLEKAGDLAEEEKERLRRQQEARALRAPVVIAVAAVLSEEPPIKRKEELAATHAAVQNMLLAAHGLGLGTIWRTGEPLYHPRMLEAFGLRPPAEMVALVYVGYPDMPPPSFKRISYAEKTVWLS
ncbi:nitroreductase [Brevibacillus sp. SYP-B805]|uniref:nitroreductase family protein n=1 Tax=Brevibacillus sp. SYP-B805 TaxID=1578199 RepID=UPI0013ECD4A9|nr:nitroreductase [Brevibacillus sp. SYP-B805]NGQ96903.1 nitroreductase [Brevibacillus sp. SYP-B805]